MYVFKPHPERRYIYLHYQAMKQAGISDPSKCLFVDDSRTNVEAAQKLGWGRCVYFCEYGMQVVEGGKVKELRGNEKELPNGIKIVSRLEELRDIWPDVFIAQQTPLSEG